MKMQCVEQPMTAGSISWGIWSGTGGGRYYSPTFFYPFNSVQQAIYVRSFDMYYIYIYLYTPIVRSEILWVPLVIHDLKKIATESLLRVYVLLVNSLMHSSFLLLSTTTLPYSNHLMEQLDGWTSHACWFLLSCQAVTKKPFGILPCTWVPQMVPLVLTEVWAFFWRFVSPKNIETYLPHPPSQTVEWSLQVKSQRRVHQRRVRRVVATINFKASMRILVCPKIGISPTIPFWGWDLRPSYSRDGSGFL